MRNLKIKFLLLLIAFISANQVLAESETLASKQELVLAIDNIDSLDPYADGENQVLLNLCETLVNSDKLGNIVPAAATSWQTKDNKTFVFKLQKNAKWSNGKPVTADDFVYSYRRAVSKNSSEESQDFFSRMYIKNVDEVIKGELPASALGVKALDKHTLQIELQKPTHFLLQTLTNPHTVPVYKESIEKFPKDWTSADKYVCNGAYKLSSINSTKVEIVRNKYYWNNAQTRIEKATWVKSKSIADDAKKFLKGQLHATYRVPLDNFWMYEKDYPDEVKNSDKITSYYLSINVDKYPMNDVRVRKALSYAIDRNILTFAYLAQGHKPSYFFTPANISGFKVEQPMYAKMTQQDRTKKAQELLKQAGFSENKPAIIKISYEHTDRNIINYTAVSAIKKIVESQLDSMKIILVPIYDRKEYISALRSRDYQVMRRGGTGNFNDAVTFLNVFMSENDSLNIGYKNTKYDQIMQKIFNTVSDSERSKLYSQAEAILQQDVPVIPLYRGGHTRLISSKIGNYPSENPEEKVYIKNLYLHN